MANQNRYKEKNNPILSVLYIIVIIILVAALVFMYKIYRDKRNAYKELVNQATRTDAGYDIEARKSGQDPSADLEDAAVENAVTLAPTAEPTTEPTAVATPEAAAASEVTVAPEVTAAPEPTTESQAVASEQQALIPETKTDELVDKSLAQGISPN